MTNLFRPNKYPARCSAFGCGAEYGPGEGYYTARIPGGSTHGGIVHLCAKHAKERADWSDTYTAPATEAPAAADAPVEITDARLDAVIAQIATLAANYSTQEVPGMVQRELAGLPGMVAEQLRSLNRELHITVAKAPAVTVKQSHKMLPTVLQAVVAGCAPFLVGPAGSGKTTLAEQVADVLKLKFYMAARVTSEFKLTGFVNAQGQTVRTQFREAYEHGGVFLFDEVDASDADAMTTFNAALSNGYCDFPDGMVRRHKNFHAIAAGNTFGRGADRQYVGRNQLDAATLDRFQIFEVDYDEELELQLAGNAEWTTFVQQVRKAIDAEKVRHIVSPRASIAGAKLLASGMDRKTVEQATVWKGLPEEAYNRVTARLRY